MIDWKKPLRLVHSKKPVRLVYTLRGENMLYPHVCVFDTKRGEACGVYGDKDIENAPEKKELWVNVYRDSCGGLRTGESFKTQADAILMVSSFNYVATVKVWEEEV